MSLNNKPILTDEPIISQDTEKEIIPKKWSRAEKICNRLILISILITVITCAVGYLSPRFASQFYLIAQISAVIFSISVLVWLGLICKGGSRVAYFVSLVLVGGGIPSAVIYGPKLHAWLESNGLSLANIAWRVGTVAGGIIFVCALFTKRK